MIDEFGLALQLPFAMTLSENRSNEDALRYGLFASAAPVAVCLPQCRLFLTFISPRKTLEFRGIGS